MITYKTKIIFKFIIVSTFHILCLENIENGFIKEAYTVKQIICDYNYETIIEWGVEKEKLHSFICQISTWPTVLDMRTVTKSSGIFCPCGLHSPTERGTQQAGNREENRTLQMKSL